MALSGEVCFRLLLLLVQRGLGAGLTLSGRCWVRTERRKADMLTAKRREGGRPPHQTSTMSIDQRDDLLLRDDQGVRRNERGPHADADEPTRDVVIFRAQEIQVVRPVDGSL